VVICLELVRDYLHMVHLIPVQPHHLLLLLLAYSGCYGKEAVIRVSVCLSSLAPDMQTGLATHFNV